MRKIMEHLLALQNLHFNAPKLSPTVLAKVRQRRAEVPSPVLAHFERLTARGKRGVAIVRDGICTECHLRITTGKLASLSTNKDICLCDNCGRYLYLPETESTGLNAMLFLPENRPIKKTSPPVI